MSGYASVNWAHARLKFDPITRKPLNIPDTETVPLLSWYTRAEGEKLRLKLAEISPIISVPCFIALCANLLIEGSITLEPKGSDYVIRTTDSKSK
jgi:hypothetical protein